MRDYDQPDLDERDAWEARTIEGDREEAELRRWEARREEGPQWDEPETEADHAQWLRREEYGDQDAPEIGEAA
jgi:hypothetical protein